MDDLELRRLEHWFGRFVQNVLEEPTWPDIPPHEKLEVAFRAGWLAHTLAELISPSGIEDAFRDEVQGG
jgi:hypothetical protein